MSKTNAKSLNGMKQNLKKKMAEHETKLAEVKKAGGLDDDDDSDDESESESESDSDSSSDDSGDDAPKGKAAFMKAAPKPAKPSAKEAKAAAAKKAEEEEARVRA